MTCNAHAKPGRPVKRKKQFPAPKRRLQDIETENTCFGSVRENKDGEILMTREMYEDMEVQLNALSESMYKQHTTPCTTITLHYIITSKL